MTMPQFAEKRCQYTGCRALFIPQGRNHLFCSYSCGHMSLAKSQIDRYRDRKEKQENALRDLARTKCKPTRTAAPLWVLSEVEKHRRVDCANYETCLGVAAACEWSGFECDACTDGYEPKPITIQEVVKLSNLAAAIDLIPGMVDE